MPRMLLGPRGSPEVPVTPQASSMYPTAHPRTGQMGRSALQAAWRPAAAPSHTSKPQQGWSQLKNTPSTRTPPASGRAGEPALGCPGFPQWLMSCWRCRRGPQQGPRDTREPRSTLCREIPVLANEHPRVRAGLGEPTHGANIPRRRGSVFPSAMALWHRRTNPLGSWWQNPSACPTLSQPIFPPQPT